MDLIVYYPYSSYTTYGDGALHASVPMEQRQARPGDSSHTGKYTLAYDKTTIDPPPRPRASPPRRRSRCGTPWRTSGS